jgi:Heparinase II/III-like protein/Heparinase II/III N-terminus
MKSFLLNLETYYRLGLVNVFIVALYRLAVKLGYFKRLQPPTQVQAPFFSATASDEKSSVPVRYFSYHEVQVSSPPDWFVNPFNQKRYDALKHWSDIPDYMPELGDIKTVWELSRFDWLPKLAWQFRQGDVAALPRLELWLRDWVSKNPPYTGINWKCGQESSLRCLNLLTAVFVLQLDKPLPGLLALLEIHMERVAPTIYYAVAQNNNHGTSEAAALFLVGSYLERFGNARQQQKGQGWAKTGRYWLENRVQNIILPDGSFSQHSLVYHRLMLDTLSLTELVRREFGLEPFSKAFYERLSLSAQWLFELVDSASGDAPNLGHNDGSYLFNVAERPYRDFRPSAQLAMALFARKKVFDTFCHPLADVFEVQTNDYPEATPHSQVWAQGAYAKLQAKDGFALIRLPRYAFRPAHADALHMDIWHQGVNVLRDGGSYSYNTTQETMNYYAGTESHNTVLFDGRDQMPRLGRYLFAAWLHPTLLDFSATAGKISSAYQDHWQVQHTRTLYAKNDGWMAVDTCSGFQHSAEIMWRLAPGAWRLEGQRVYGDSFTLEIEGEVTLELSEASESRYYLTQTSLPVLRVRCLAAATITTHIRFNP